MSVYAALVLTLGFGVATVRAGDEGTSTNLDVIIEPFNTPTCFDSDGFDGSGSSSLLCGASTDGGENLSAETSANVVSPQGGPQTTFQLRGILSGHFSGGSAIAHAFAQIDVFYVFPDGGSVSINVTASTDPFGTGEVCGTVMTGAEEQQFRFSRFEQTNGNWSFSATLPPGGFVSFSAFARVQSLGTSLDDDLFAVLSGTVSVSRISNPDPGGLFDWVNPLGGAFGNANNWSSVVVPGANDTGVVSLGGAVPIDFTAGASAAHLRVRGTSVDLFGGQMVLSGAAPDDPSLSIGNLGEIALHGGKIICVDAAIGDVPGGPISLLSLAGDSTNTPALSALGTVSVGLSAPGRLAVSNGTLECDTLTLFGMGSSSADFEGVGSRNNEVMNLNVGLLGPATLSIKAGALLFATNAQLGSLADGTAIVQGVGDFGGTPAQSALDVFNLRVGDEAAGTLEIRDGGIVHAIAPPSQVLVGPGSILVSGVSGVTPAQLIADNLVVGSVFRADGLGTLTVENGGFVRAFDSLAIGAGQSPGTVKVQTGGEVWTTQLILGGDNQPAGSTALALLSVTDSPDTDHIALQVDDLAAFVGVYAHLTLSGGGKANFNNGLEIRPTGSAELEAFGKNTFATVIGPMVVAGESDLAPASVFVHDGAVVSKATDASASLQVGSLSKRGHGFIQIEHPVAGFDDPVKAQMAFDNIDIQLGTITIKGAGQLGANQQLTVGSGSRLEVDSNLLNFVNVQCDKLVIKAGGVVRCCPTGGIQATVAIVNDDGALLEGGVNVTGNVATSGLIRVGCSSGPIPMDGNFEQAASSSIGIGVVGIGTMTIDGDFEQTPSGVLEIEYAGLNSGEFDVLHVTGKATLCGRIEVLFRNGFSPADPNAFIHSQFFVEAEQGIVGDYDQRIYAFPDLFADFDDDGDKDLRDVAAFQNCFGLSGNALQPACTRADWEDNGVINEVEARELASRLTGPS